VAFRHALIRRWSHKRFLLCYRKRFVLYDVKQFAWHIYKHILQSTRRTRAETPGEFHSGSWLSTIPGEFHTQAERAMEVGDTHPRFTAVAFGRGGSVWVRLPPVGDALLRYDRPLDPLEPFGIGGEECVVFSRDGEPLRSVSLPSGFRPMDYWEDRVYGVHTDPLGIQTVQV